MQEQVNKLILDIETLWNVVGSWDTYSKGGWSATHVFMEWFPLGVGLKWYGEEGYYVSLEKYKGYRPPLKLYKNGDVLLRKPNIKPMLKDVWECLDKADEVITWNGKKFDIRKLNDKFVAHGFNKFTPFKHTDIMLIKRSIAASNSYSLDYTGQQWGTARKQEHEGKGLWLKVAQGDLKACQEMEDYCLQDLVVTEKNYDHLLMKGWIENALPMNVLLNLPDVCPTCGAQGTIVKGMKYKATRGNRYQYCRCTNCNSPVKLRIPEESYQKMRYVN
jgi:hypothetical protein